MNHFTLPEEIRAPADRQFALLRSDPRHPSLHFKKVGSRKQLWSARVGLYHRALGLDKPAGVVWVWIGTHGDYDKILAQS